MAQNQSQYHAAYKARKKAEEKPADNNSMTIEGADVVDESGPDLPKIPPKKDMTFPVDDAFAKYRTQQT